MEKPSFNRDNIGYRRVKIIELIFMRSMSMECKDYGLWIKNPA